jgi:uncharacterized protein YhaN
MSLRRRPAGRNRKCRGRKPTCGSFGAVDTDFDEADQPVLVGVRPDGRRLRVESMSTGTCDQLYLALRLATLEHYLDSSEPLPFIVDDILSQFDEERARATLEALAYSAFIALESLPSRPLVYAAWPGVVA